MAKQSRSTILAGIKSFYLGESTESAVGCILNELISKHLLFSRWQLFAYTYNQIRIPSSEIGKKIIAADSVEAMRRILVDIKESGKWNSYSDQKYLQKPSSQDADQARYQYRDSLKPNLPAGLKVKQSQYKDHRTACIALIEEEKDLENDKWKLIVFDTLRDAKEALKGIDTTGYEYNFGVWWSRAFWFPDLDHSATFVLSQESAIAYLSEAQYADVVDEFQYEEDREPEAGDLVHLSFDQHSAHPYRMGGEAGIDEFTESEILEFYGYPAKLLATPGACFDGWWDG